MPRTRYTVEYLIKHHGPRGIWYRSDTYDLEIMANAHRKSLLQTMRNMNVDCRDDEVRVRKITGKAPAMTPVE